MVSFLAASLILLTVPQAQSKNTFRMRGMNSSGASRSPFGQPALPYEVPGVCLLLSCLLIAHVLLCSVPIFDGRRTPKHPPFMFTDDDFKNLPKWPLWKGTDELPPDSLVVVGYTWTTYTGYSSTSPSLSSNLLFVILLGLGDEAASDP